MNTAATSRLPMVRIADERTLAAAAAPSDGLARMRGICDWVGEGRPLDASRPRAEDLDEIAAAAGIEGEDAGSNAEFTFMWAASAGLLDVSEDGSLATVAQRGRAFDSAPLDVWFAVARTWCAAAGIGPGLRGDDQEVDEQLVLNLRPMYGALQPTPAIELVDWAEHRLVERLGEAARERAGRLRSALVDLVGGVLATMRLFGAVLADEDGNVELTPLGTWFMQKLATEAGLDAPIAGSLATTSATELFAALVGKPLNTKRLELACWVDARDDKSGALLEIAAAGGSIEDVLTRQLVLDLLDAHAESGEAAARKLRELPYFAGMALLWLIDHGYEPEELRADVDLPTLLVEQAATMVEHLGPEQLVDFLLGRWPEGLSAMLVPLVAGVGTPDAAVVLEAVGRFHPEKPVAKAARAELHRLRSRLG